MSDMDELVASINGLNEMAATLTASADALAASSKAQDKVLKRIEALAIDTHRNRVALQLGTLGVVIALAVGGFAVVQSMRLNTLYHQVQEVQTRTSTEVLCPLYQLFALSITVNPPSPNYTPEQLKLRQQFAEAMATGLTKLGCPKQ